MGTPRLTLTIVRAGPENTWGSPAVLHDSLQHTHTSVWPRERLFFFSFGEKTSSWLASHLITRRTVGIYSYTLLALDWKQTNQRFVVQRWKKTTFEGEKETGAQFTSAGPSSDVKRSGRVESIVWLTPTTTLLVSSRPYVIHGWRRKNAETPARRNGRLLHPITSSNRRRRHLAVDFYTSLTRLPTDAHFSSSLENFGIHLKTSSWRLQSFTIENEC